MSTPVPANHSPGNHRTAVEHLINAGILAPAARSMPLDAIAYQHNQANAMTPADPGYIAADLPLSHQVYRLIDAMAHLRRTRRRNHTLW